jgi:glycosyltransferase involved in cell wall biosynthesis
MPMVVMEAMCAGCAVIQTASGGAIELAERAVGCAHVDLIAAE